MRKLCCVESSVLHSVQLHKRQADGAQASLACGLRLGLQSADSAYG
jgi:hypothetical protein